MTSAYLAGADNGYSLTSAELSRVIKPFQLSPYYARLQRSLGFDSHRAHNLHYVSPNRLLTIGGNTAQLLDATTGAKSILSGHGSAIGCVCVHPNQQLFAVAECGPRPVILIYRASDLTVLRVLKHGAEQGFGCISFDSSGTRLASVSSSPDYSLCVWDWQAERLVLKSKAFSQDVTRVQFSPFNAGALVTSGTGHIRFWSIADTFTGLKLQGSIGKFGLVELSDIGDFAQLEDGKVVSGSESGALLVWDGHTIAYQVCRSDRSPCHAGEITVVRLHGKHLVTAGVDGYLRMWRVEDFEFADSGEDDNWAKIEPLKEFHLGTNVSVASLTEGEQGQFYLADRSGGVLQFTLDSDQATRITHAHSGAISATVCSPLSHSTVTGGSDGSVRAWNLTTGALLCSRLFSAPCTSLHWAAAAVDPDQQATIIAGFGDGVIRVLHRYLESFVLACAAKPHISAVTSIATSHDGSLVVTADDTGAVFFFAIEPGHRAAALQPIGVSRFTAPVHALSFSPYATTLLAASGDRVLEITPPPRPCSDALLPESYSVAVSHREWRVDLSFLHQVSEYSIISKEELDIATIKRIERERELTESEREHAKKRREERSERRKKRREQRELEATRTYRIGCILRAPHHANEFIFTVQPEPTTGDTPCPASMLAAVYRASFDSVTPSTEFRLGSQCGVVTSLALSPNSSLLLIGCVTGVVQVRSVHEPQWFFQWTGHSSAVTALVATVDERFIVSSGADSMIFAHSVDCLTALALADRSIEGARDIDAEKRIEAQKDKRKAQIEEASGISIEETNTTAIYQYSDSEREDEAREAQFEAANATTIPGPEPVNEGEQPSDAGGFGAELVAESLPSAVTVSDLPDSLSSASYSLEEAKAKAEDDDRRREIARRQEQLRAEVKKCRDEFAKLQVQRAEFERKLTESGTAKTQHQLPVAWFADLDPELERAIAQDTQQKLATIDAAAASELERAKLQRNKLKQFFLEPVEVQPFAVHAFDLHDSETDESTSTTGNSTGVSAGNGPCKAVWSFRVTRLPDSLKREIAAVQLSLRASPDAPLPDSSVTVHESADPLMAALEARHATPPADADRDSQRTAREARLAWLADNRPDGRALLPAELEMLAHSAASLGDFALKSASDFVVTEDRAVNAEGKRVELVLIAEAIYELKMAFNDKLAALRDIRGKLVHSITRDLQQHHIGDTVRDHRDRRILADILQPVAGQAPVESMNPATAVEAKTEFLAQPPAAVCLTDAMHLATATVPASESMSASASDAAFDFLDNTESALASAFVAQFRAALVARLLHALKEFNLALDALHFDRLKLVDDLCSAESRLFLCHTELAILAEFEEREGALNERRRKLIEAKRAIKSEQSELERAVAAKHRELTAAHDREKQTLQEFAAAIGGEKNEFFPILNKIFRKRIKRRKRRAPSAPTNAPHAAKKSGSSEHSSAPVASGNETKREPQSEDDDGLVDGGGDDRSDALSDVGSDSGADSGADSGDESEFDGSDGSDSDEDGDGDELCPPHCPVVAYEKTLEYRERRLDTEEWVAELGRTLSELTRALDRLVAKEKALEKDWAVLEKERARFQSDKQRQLNLIEATATLDASQCQVVTEEARLPHTLDSALVFTEGSLRALEQRIDAIANETAALSDTLVDAKRAGRAVEKENETWRGKIDEERARCESVQRLKFGRLVDLDFILANPGAQSTAAQAAKKAALSELEQQTRDRSAQAHRELSEARAALHEALSVNTALRQRQAALTVQQFALEGRLNASAALSASAAITGAEPEDERTEKTSLIALVKAHESEIEQLKAEMTVLRRKGGRIIVNPSIDPLVAPATGE